MAEKRLSCADCSVLNCGLLDREYPAFCPTPGMDPKFMEEVMAEYEKGNNKEIMKASAEVEYEYYCRHTRVEECMDFANKIGAKKIGIASCAGLFKEAHVLAEIIRAHGFEVFGICCKAGAKNKVDVGIKEECCAVGKTMCNPILQAKMLNKEKTDLNLVVGLCVGHDSLFYRYSDALVTTVVTKDRVTGHNPVAVLNTTHSYRKGLLNADW